MTSMHRRVRKPPPFLHRADSLHDVGQVLQRTSIFDRNLLGDKSEGLGGATFTAHLLGLANPLRAATLDATAIRLQTTEYRVD